VRGSPQEQDVESGLSESPHQRIFPSGDEGGYWPLSLIYCSRALVTAVRLAFLFTSRDFFWVDWNVEIPRVERMPMMMMVIMISMRVKPFDSLRSLRASQRGRGLDGRWGDGWMGRWVEDWFIKNYSSLKYGTGFGKCKRKNNSLFINKLTGAGYRSSEHLLSQGATLQYCNILLQDIILSCSKHLASKGEALRSWKFEIY
jgi:hypothetical protein